MNAPTTPWMALAMQQAVRCHHLAWFLYGCLEREHRLNVDAALSGWGRMDPSPARGSSPTAATPATPAGTAGSTPAGAGTARPVSSRRAPGCDRGS